MNINSLLESPLAKIKKGPDTGQAEISKSRAGASPSGGVRARAGVLEEASQAALRVSEIRYRRLFEAARDGVLLTHLATPVEGRAGEVVGASKISHDITRIKKLEAQFIEAQKMEVMGQLAGGVAHDFNNILAVIMGYSDLIAEEVVKDSPLQKHNEEIRHALELAAGLTRQLLNFSRKETVQPLVLNLNDVVKDLDKMLLRLIDENIEMMIILGKQAGRIKADFGYIEQVVMNLVVNARDAMPNGGKLTITTSDIMLDENHARAHTGAMPGDYVMLSVSDTGTGMTDEVKAHLFEAFFTTKPKGKGTGLGLATCQTIVQQCGGHIALSSKVGQGTTFRIYFPRVEQPVDVAARSIQTGPLRASRNNCNITIGAVAPKRFSPFPKTPQGYRA